MRVLVKVLLILLFFITHVFAGDAQVFTDHDLKEYGGSTTLDTGTSVQEMQDNGSGTYVSPQESDLRQRKDEVIKENRDYIEDQYRWMKEDCNNYEGESRKSCFFGTEEWYKEELRKLKELEEYLSK